MLSKKSINSYVGDVVHLEFLTDDEDIQSLNWKYDGAVANIREFPDFKNAVLVSLMTCGEGFVSAELNGKEYTVSVTSREMEAQVGQYSYYFADLHTHTSSVHDHDKFALHETENVEDYVEKITDDTLDLAVISDHAIVTNDNDFCRGFKLAEGVNKPIVFAGAESELVFIEKDRFGIPRRHSGEIVTLKSAGYVCAYSYREFEYEHRYSKAPIAIFAHPNTVGFSTKGIWNFDFAKHNTDFMKNIICGIEMGNGADMKSNLIHEYAISAALDAGYRVSTTCSSDAHGPKYGYNVIPGKTVIMAKERSHEAFHCALRNMRFYATESGDVKLKYSVNGIAAPADLPITDTYTFKIELETFSGDTGAMPVVCQIISDYGKTLAKAEIKGCITELTVKSAVARYFYLRLIDKEGRKTWSMPVFTGREYDKQGDECLIALDGKDFIATYKGKAIPEVIDGNLYNPWHADVADPEVIIDMRGEYEISAIGYSPRQVYFLENRMGWEPREDIKTLVSEYEIYTSQDGVSYELVAHRVAQSFSDENIISFAPKTARFVKFKALSNIGLASHRPNYKDTKTSIGNLAVFKKA